MTDPSVSTIAPGYPFAKVLAGHVLERYGADPQALSRVLILLPSRRACQALGDAFLHQTGGKPLLLPQIQPIGEVDSDLLMGGALSPPPPAMPDARRLIWLARLIYRYQKQAADLHPSMEHALHLARSLAELIDELAREQIPLERLRAVAPEDFAGHWQLSLDFLEIILTEWPHILEREQMLETEARRNAVLEQLAAHWRSSPANFPVIAAGTTGSIPAVASLLSVIARLPQGEVILPGLDTRMEEAIWDTIGPTHPQYGMKELLARIEVERESVKELLPLEGGADDQGALATQGVVGERGSVDSPSPQPSPQGERELPPTESAAPLRLPPKGGVGAARRDLLRAVMLPPSATHHWRTLSPERVAAGMQGVSRVYAGTPETEALLITLRLRDALEQPERTAMLVTHDRALARRVSTLLGRYDIRIDDSAGMRLLDTPPGVLFRLIAEVGAGVASPVALLALLKHPLTCLGFSRATVRDAARAIERHLLRGTAPEGGLDGVLAAARHSDALPDDACTVLERLHQVLTPMRAASQEKGKANFAELFDAHMDALTQCVTQKDGKRDMFGQRPDATELETTLQAWREEATAMETLPRASYPAVMETMLADAAYRPPYATHPRLRILSPMEARMQQADLVILGGMNEGSWPGEVEPSPWLSRPMRTPLGLPPPERSVGLAAHDFAMLCMAPELLLTRARKQGGTPTLASRWLLRLDACLHEVGNVRHELRQDAATWTQWGEALLAPKQRIKIRPPAPTPPMAARPKKLSATQIELLLRDPYGLYAKQILRLRALDPIDEALSPVRFGILVHHALEQFTRAYPERLPEDAGAVLLNFGRESFANLLHHPQVRAFWWPRFVAIARWVVEQETARRDREIKTVVPEQSVRMDIDGHTLTARIDRVEHYHNGSVGIVDYKTGQLPPIAMVQEGYACQLPLEALLVHETLGQEISCLEYWRLTGGKEEGNIRQAAGNKTPPEALITRTAVGVARLLTLFGYGEQPYLSCPAPAARPAYSDYEHLARIGEWGT